MSADVETQLRWLSEAMDDVVGDVDVADVLDRAASQRWSGSDRFDLDELPRGAGGRSGWLVAAGVVLVVGLVGSLWWIRDRTEPVSGPSTSPTSPVAVETMPLDLPDDALPADATLRVVVDSTVGQFQIFDSASTNQTCQVLFRSDSTMAGCVDNSVVADGMAYSLVGDHQRLLFGIFPNGDGYHVTVGNQTVQPDRNGIWFIVLDEDVDEYTVTTPTAETIIHLASSIPLATTIPPTPEAPASTVDEEADWTDPPPAISFDEAAEWGALLRQADVLHRGKCMADRGLEYRLPPLAFDPTITDGPQADVWQQWYDDKVDSSPGWEADLLECADEFLNSGWAGDINPAGYVSEVHALQVTGRNAVWRTPEITPLVDDIVACAQAQGGSVATPVAEDPERANEQARDILEPLISIENIDGMSQQEWSEAREAAFDAVCPVWLDLDRAVNTARQDVERQWLLDNPQTAQRINDEWADDIVRLRQIIASYDLDALTG